MLCNPITCDGCGATFTPKKPAQHYCTLECFRSRGSTTLVSRLCPICGKTFLTKRGYLRLGRGVHCSKTCYSASQRRPIEQRFWDSVVKTPTCWLWHGQMTAEGYGYIATSRPNRQNILAHRYSYELHCGTIPDGLFVLHRCDVLVPPGDKTYRRCVNPAHLFLGTHEDNMADMVAKGRAATGERNGKVIRQRALTS